MTGEIIGFGVWSCALWVGGPMLVGLVLIGYGCMIRRRPALTSAERKIVRISIAVGLALTVLGGCNLVAALGGSARQADDAGQEAPADSAAAFVRAEGTGFVLNGEPFYAPGTNIYYLLTYGAAYGRPDDGGDRGTRDYVDEVLIDAANMGLKVIRMWAFCDGADQWNALQTAPGEFDEGVFRGLDYVIYKADELGLRLILPLVNGLDDYGGMDQYVAWDAEHGTDPDEVADEHNDFYTDADIRQWYKDFVAAVINRRNTYTGVLYRDDPTILAWELANEPRATGDTSGDILQAWLEEMAAYVKSIDSNHMLTTGVEGLYNRRRSDDWLFDGSEGQDFIRNHQIEGIDFATVHVYPDEWDLSYEEVLAWYQEHIDQARDVLHMPLLLEEFGQWPAEDGSVEGRERLFEGIFDLAEQEDCPGWNFWMLVHRGYVNGGYDINAGSGRDAATVEMISNAAYEMNIRSGASDEEDEADESDDGDVTESE